jgi:hypothetical protein
MVRRLFKHHTAIRALAFKHRRAIVQAMGEDVNLGVIPFDKLTVHPDKSGQLIEGHTGHGLHSQMKNVLC